MLSAKSYLLCLWVENNRHVSLKAAENFQCLHPHKQPLCPPFLLTHHQSKHRSWISLNTPPSFSFCSCGPLDLSPGCLSNIHCTTLNNSVASACTIHCKPGWERQLYLTKMHQCTPALSRSFFRGNKSRLKLTEWGPYQKLHSPGPSPPPYLPPTPPRSEHAAAPDPFSGNKILYLNGLSLTECPTALQPNGISTSSLQSNLSHFA